MIQCIPALTASPDTIRIPGVSIFAFRAAVTPDSTDPDPHEAIADVEYEIEDKSCRVCFSNGQKTISTRARVTAGGTTVRETLRFVCCGGGTEPPIIVVTATVREEGVLRCGPLHFALQIDGYDC
jgi:hypothetical protein